MPILDVEIVLGPDERLNPQLAAELADRVGELLDAAPGTVWVKVRAIRTEDYAENGIADLEVFPVFVSILKGRQLRGSEREAEVATLTSAIAEVCGRPAANVHIVYEPDASGRIAFGGVLFKDSSVD